MVVVVVVVVGTNVVRVTVTFYPVLLLLCFHKGKVKSAYEPSGPSGLGLSRFL